MLAKRIIPCLDCDLAVPGGRVVKGIKFENIQYVGDPVNLAERYYQEGADEISFLDITASIERRETMIDVIKKVSKKVFVPLSVGGGITKIEDFKKLLEAGADKCSIGTAAIKTPDLINKASERFGNQCVIVSLDVKDDEIYIYGGRTPTGINVIEFAKEVEKRGAGEILLNSIDSDGAEKGYDIELIKRTSQAVSVPVIASGGCGSLKDILEVFKRTKATAALAASVFHYKKYKISQVKQFLKNNGIKVRI